MTKEHLSALYKLIRHTEQSEFIHMLSRVLKRLLKESSESNPRMSFRHNYYISIQYSSVIVTGLLKILLDSKLYDEVQNIID